MTRAVSRVWHWVELRVSRMAVLWAQQMAETKVLNLADMMVDYWAALTADRRVDWKVL